MLLELLLHFVESLFVELVLVIVSFEDVISRGEVVRLLVEDREERGGWPTELKMELEEDADVFIEELEWRC